MSNPDFVQMVNGEPKIHLHSGQGKAWMSEARFTFIVAGTQSGKTSFCSVPGGFGTRSSAMARAITYA